MALPPEKKDILVILPARNESMTLPDVLASLEDNGITQFADILVVDDSSTDDTISFVKKTAIRQLLSFSIWATEPLCRQAINSP